MCKRLHVHKCTSCFSINTRVTCVVDHTCFLVNVTGEISTFSAKIIPCRYKALHPLLDPFTKRPLVLRLFSQINPLWT